MKRFIILAILALGCRSAEKVDVSPFEYRFEKTHDKEESTKRTDKGVVAQFDSVPFGQAMAVLSQETGVPIVWGSQLDKEQAVGRFQGVPLATVLDVLSRRAGASVAEIGGVYYLGDIKRQDRAFCVLRIPPVDRKQIEAAIKSSISDQGVVSMVGSCIWICDNIESLRKVTTAIEIIRERSERSYIAEVYFIRVNEEHFVNLTADLQIRQIDIFSSAFNIEELFMMFVDGDAGTGWSKVSQRPVLYLSEGRQVTFTDGKEITREKRTVTETGHVETSGYQKFPDGLQLTMKLDRVSDKSYAVDMDMSVSIFDKNDKSNIPAMEKSSYKADGLRVQDSQVYYIGSLRRDQRSDKGGFFSFNFSKSHDMITIWLRVRELKGS